jgi:hypothetical protein
MKVKSDGGLSGQLQYGSRGCQAGSGGISDSMIMIIESIRDQSPHQCSPGLALLYEH